MIKFSKDNVINNIKVDMGSRISTKIIESEIRKMMKLIRPCEDNIRIETQYPFEKEINILNIIN